jgi:hypothetical protein
MNRAIAARRQPAFLWQPVKGAALARPNKTLRDGENIMTVLGYFLIAAIAGVATSAIIGFILTSLFIARSDKGDQPSRIKYLITSFGGSR